MATTYNGNAAGISLATALSITIPADGDPLAVSSVNTPLQRLADYAEAMRARATFTGAAPNGFGITGTGVGTGVGVVGTVTGPNATGVMGTGSGAGAGVFGRSGGSGPAVTGDNIAQGVTTGPGGLFRADTNATAPAIDLIPSTVRGAIHLAANAPTAPSDGDMWFDSGTSTLRFRVGGVTKTITWT